VLGPWRAEWERKGGARFAEKIVRASHWLMIVLVVGFLLALLGVVLLIRMLVS
jgi:CHASE3 domain sensor protein